MSITPILATHLVPDMVGDTISLYATNGKRVTGTLTAYCRHIANYTVEIDGTLHKGIRHSAEIDHHTNTGQVAA